MGTKDRRDIKPFLIKCGVAFAISFGGILYSRIKAKRISDSQRKRDYGGRFRIVDDSEQDSDPVHSNQYDEKTRIQDCVDTTATNGSPIRCRCRGYKDGLLTTLERDKYEKEIENLKRQIRFLREQERNFEVKLVEYSSLKEKETTLRELQSRLKIHDIESKLFSMKIESLRADNKRLESQVVDYEKVVGELEGAKAKIKFLKRKIRNEAEEHKEKILELTYTVGKLQEEEVSSCCNSNVQLEIQKVKELEKCNRSTLQQENDDLGRRLESNQLNPEKEQHEEERLRLRDENSNQSMEIEKLKAVRCKDAEEPQKEQHDKERLHLREENSNQSMEIEKLKADRCKDGEELVSLRWMNACLRCELKNCKAQPTKDVKEKQYTNVTEDTDKDEPSSVIDSDVHNWPYSQPSYHTDNSSSSQNSLDNNDKHYKKNRKFLTKLKKLINKGKREGNTHESFDHSLSSPRSGSSPQDSPSHEDDSRDVGSITRNSPSELDYTAKGKSYGGSD